MNKKQRLGIEDRGEGEGTRVRGQGCLSQRDKGLLLDREETGIVHRKMAVYKDKSRNLWDRMWCLILIEHVNWAS